MKRALVIDDEQLLLDLLGYLLSKFGYEVDRALDSQEAAGKLKEETYDVIFLDMKMPVMSGRDFYLKVKEYFPETAKRIIFLTGDLGNQETLRFIEKTGNLYLPKPFGIREIKTLLDKFSMIHQEGQSAPI